MILDQDGRALSEYGVYTFDAQTGDEDQIFEFIEV
jgi:hypothetical protein